MARSFDLCIIGSGSGNTIVDERFRGTERGADRQRDLRRHLPQCRLHPDQDVRLPGRSRPHSRSRRAARCRTRSARSSTGPRSATASSAGSIAISRDGEQGRRDDPDITVLTAEARFTGPRRLRVGEDTIVAERVVIAAGSRPVIPTVPGLADVGYHTSDDIMRLGSLPRSMVILGGGYVAAEFAHVFAAFGTEVTVVNRSQRLLSRQDRDVAERFTDEIGSAARSPAGLDHRSARSSARRWSAGHHRRGHAR